jgi:hypothetical protein
VARERAVDLSLAERFRSDNGVDAYCRWQERRTSRLIVDEDEKPFEAPEPEHIAAIRAVMAKLREKDPE